MVPFTFYLSVGPVHYPATQPLPSACPWGQGGAHIFKAQGPRTQTPWSGSATVRHRRCQRGMSGRRTNNQTFAHYKICLLNYLLVYVCLVRDHDARTSPGRRRRRRVGKSSDAESSLSSSAAMNHSNGSGLDHSVGGSTVNASSDKENILDLHDDSNGGGDGIDKEVSNNEVIIINGQVTWWSSS